MRLLMPGHRSYRAEYERAVEHGLARPASPRVLTEGDLEPLPGIVRKYLRSAGVVGQPRVRDVRVRMRGQIRSAPDARWMAFVADQHNFHDEPSRFALFEASVFGVPIQALHLYADAAATMRVQVAGLLQIVDAKGPVMTQAETVTLLNDMCLLAPATLISDAIRWEVVDALAVRAAFTHAGHRIEAVLVFNVGGELVDFRSDDRGRSSADGKSFTRMPWSTPISGYRPFGAYRLGARGEARWHPPEGEFTYARIVIEEVEYNLRGPGTT